MEEVKKDVVPIKDKFLWSIYDVMELFNLGERKVRSIAKDDLLYGNSQFTVSNGNRILFKRDAFLEFINKTTSI